MMQTPTVALPMMGAKLGWANSAREMKQATREWFSKGFSIEKHLRNDEEREAYAAGTMKGCSTRHSLTTWPAWPKAVSTPDRRDTGQ